MSGGLEAEFKVRRNGFALDVSLAIERGRTVALLGPNGAGKSSVVEVVAGLLPIDEGEIRLGGSILDSPRRSVFEPPEVRRVGVVFQDYVLFPHLSVIGNVAFGLRSRGVDRGEAHRRAGVWMSRVGLGGMGDRMPGDLSGGQAQRVALARALAIEPELLLLDEPLAALDIEIRASLRRELARHLGGYEGPRMLITHEPTEAFLLADEVVVIEEGSVTQRGTADEIRLRPRTSYAAGVADVNLFRGMASDGVVETGDHILHIADHDVSGPVLAVIRPASVSVHLARPEGSPRNSWQTKLELVEQMGDRTRLLTGPPLPMAVEITSESTEALHLASGSSAWVSIKATEIAVQPDG